MNDYPKFQATPVGLAPDRMKMLKPEDLEALREAFWWLTGIDPLRVESVAAAWESAKLEGR